MIKQIFKFTIFAFIISVAAPHGTHAGEPRKLKWTDLTPLSVPLKNPLSVLSIDQRLEFDNIEFWLSLEPNPSDRESITDYKDAKRAAAKSRKILIKQGFNVEDLYEQYEKWQDELERRSQLTTKKFNGKQVSLAGYLLPLDFAKNGVKEFLLVPYVGACIHTPPPPLNQIAFVRLNKPYKVKELYDPVWVTGRMNTKRVSKNLSFVDGASMIEAGYILTGETIKKYSRPN